MRRLGIVVATGAAALAVSTGVAAASTHTLAALITVQKTTKHGLDWDVMGSGGRQLGNATEVANKKGTVWKFDFKLGNGSIRTTWYFTERNRDFVLTRAPIVGGSGHYAGESGYASVRGVAAGDRSTSNLAGSSFIQVVFHLERARARTVG